MLYAFGLLGSQQTTPEERRDDDKSRVNRVVQEIMGLDITVQNHPMGLGRYIEVAQKPSPIEFSVDSVVMKQKIIDGSRLGSQIMIFVRTCIFRVTSL